VIGFFFTSRCLFLLVSVRPPSSFSGSSQTRPFADAQLQVLFILNAGSRRPSFMFFLVHFFFLLCFRRYGSSFLKRLSPFWVGAPSTVPPRPFLALPPRVMTLLFFLGCLCGGFWVDPFSLHVLSVRIGLWDRLLLSLVVCRFFCNYSLFFICR